MMTPAIDILAHQAARLSRRRSLLSLGGAMMLATTAVGAETAVSRKHGKNGKNGKSGRKGNGADCQKRERQRCSADAAACKATVATLCTPDNADVCLVVQACCESCSADAFLTCFLAVQAA